jgi:hypothetical protein
MDAQITPVGLQMIYCLPQQGSICANKKMVFCHFSAAISIAVLKNKQEACFVFITALPTAQTRLHAHFS